MDLNFVFFFFMTAVFSHFILCLLPPPPVLIGSCMVTELCVFVVSWCCCGCMVTDWVVRIGCFLVLWVHGDWSDLCMSVGACCCCYGCMVADWVVRVGPCCCGCMVTDLCCALLLARVLIVDWDVHHGQATQYMFYNDPRWVVWAPWPSCYHFICTHTHTRLQTYTYSTCAYYGTCIIWS